jgi:hypothetical protein
MLKSCHFKETVAVATRKSWPRRRRRAGSLEICIGEWGAEVRPNTLGGSRIIDEPDSKVTTDDKAQSEQCSSHRRCSV